LPCPAPTSKTVGAVVSDFDIRISDFSTFETPKVELNLYWKDVNER